MSSLIQPDTLMQSLCSLPVVAPDANRAEARRVRCRQALESSDAVRDVRWLEPAVGVACAAYALQLARIAILLAR